MLMGMALVRLPMEVLLGILKSILMVNWKRERMGILGILNLILLEHVNRIVKLVVPIWLFPILFSSFSLGNIRGESVASPLWRSARLKREREREKNGK